MNLLPIGRSIAYYPTYRFCVAPQHHLIFLSLNIYPMLTMLKIFKTLKTILLSATLGIVLLVGSLNYTAPALAHTLDTNYAFDLMQSNLKFTSVFSTGEPLEQGTVEIYAPGNSETPWQTLETDESGSFSFAPDLQQPGEWTVKIGQGGHSDLWTIPVSNGGGIEFEQISQTATEDVHYANLGSAWAGLVGAALGALVYYGYKVWRSAEQA
jgi:nickel transport protein